MYKKYPGRNLHKKFEMGHNLQRPFLTPSQATTIKYIIMYLQKT